MIAAALTQHHATNRDRRWKKDEDEEEEGKRKKNPMRELWKIHFGDKNQTLFGGTRRSACMSVCVCRCWCDRCSFCDWFFSVQGLVTKKKFGPYVYVCLCVCESVVCRAKHRSRSIRFNHLCIRVIFFYTFAILSIFFLFFFSYSHSYPICWHICAGIESVACQWHEWSRVTRTEIISNWHETWKIEMELFIHGSLLALLQSLSPVD